MDSSHPKLIRKNKKNIRFKGKIKAINRLTKKILNFNQR